MNDNSPHATVRSELHKFKRGKEEKPECMSHTNAQQESGNYDRSLCASQILVSVSDYCCCLTLPWTTFSSLLLWFTSPCCGAEWELPDAYIVPKTYLHRCICIFMHMLYIFQIYKGMRTCTKMWNCLTHSISYTVSFTPLPITFFYLQRWLKGSSKVC